MEPASVRRSFLKPDLFLSITQCGGAICSRGKQTEPRAIVLYLFSRMFVNKVETQRFSRRPAAQYGNREAHLIAASN